MKIEKVYAFIGDDGTPHLLGVIWHEGCWWIVASWLLDHSTGTQMPERIIRMDGVFVKYQEVRKPDHRFLLQNAIPISVYDGKTQDGYVVAIYPGTLLHTHPPSSIH